MFLLPYYTETFQDVVGYNNTNIPHYTVDTTYSQQTNSIVSLLDAANQKNALYDNVDVEKTDENIEYSLYNKNIDFPLSKTFKTALTQYLINNEVFGDKVYISSDILNMYTKDF